MENLSTKMDPAVEKIQQPDVKKSATAASKSLDALVIDYKKYAAAKDQASAAALEAEVPTVQSTFTALQKMCG